MVLKKLREKFTKAKAKRLGMTVAELKKARKDLKRKEGEERLKHEKWKIEQKYKQKKQAKKGKGGGVTGLITLLGGSGQNDSDPLGLFGSPKKPRKKKRKKKRR